MSFCDWCQKEVAELHAWTDFEVCVDCLATLPEMPSEASSDDDEVRPLDEEPYLYDEQQSVDADGSWDNAVKAFEDTRE